MIIVSNTSPLSSLAKIDRLILLRQIYERIIIPQAVYDELTDIRAGERVNKAIKKATWIETRQITNLLLIRQLESTLDQGEAEAITLAVELKANQLIMDERLGRKQANQLGLSLIGVLGVLLIAKHQGLIDSVKSVMDELISQTAFRIGNRLYENILQQVNETE